jgi:serine/threonine protein kinase
MLLDLSSSLVRSIRFLSFFCISGVQNTEEKVRKGWKEEVQPQQALLEENEKVRDALLIVQDAISTVSSNPSRVFLANRGECKEMAERIALLAEEIELLAKEYRKEEHSSKPDVLVYAQQLNISLTEIFLLLASNLCPSSSSSSPARTLNWAIQQSRRSEDLRSSFLTYGETIGASMKRLGQRVGIAIPEHVIRLAKESEYANARSISRADLLEFNQRNEAAIREEMTFWSTREKEEHYQAYHHALDHLEEHSAEQSARVELKLQHKRRGSFAVSLDPAELEKCTGKIQKLSAIIAASPKFTARPLNLPSGSPTPSARTVKSPSLSLSSSVSKYRFSVLTLNDIEPINFDPDPTASECIGEGATGDVWRSKLKQGATPIAFKRLKLPKSMDLKQRESIKLLVKREAELIWLLNGHPNTVQLYGAILEREVGLVFGLCNRGNLQSLLYEKSTEKERQGEYDSVKPPEGLTRKEQIACVTQLISAVYFAHSRNIVHRDIKSQNVLVHDCNHTPAQESSAPEGVASPPSSASSRLLSFRLSDFGSAHALQHISASAFSPAVSSPTNGTLLWTPAELLKDFDDKSFQEQRELQYSPAVDIYGLGLVIGEVFAALPPFAGSLRSNAKDYHILTAILNEKRQPFDYAALAEISPALAGLVKMCCSRIPSERPNASTLLFKEWPLVVSELNSSAEGEPPNSPTAGETQDCGTDFEIVGTWSFGASSPSSAASSEAPFTMRVSSASVCDPPSNLAPPGGLSLSLPSGPTRARAQSERPRMDGEEWTQLVDPALVQEARRRGGAVEVMRLMNTHPNDAVIQQESLLALLELCELKPVASPSSISAAAGRGFDYVLPSSLSSSSSTFSSSSSASSSTSSSSVLPSSSSSSSPSPCDLIEPEVILRAMSSLKANLIIQQQGAQILVRISEVEEVASRVRTAGGVAELVRAMSEFPYDSTLQLSGCSALANLSIQSHAREAVVTDGAVPVLMLLFKNHLRAIDIMRPALTALSFLSEFDASKPFIEANSGLALIVTAMTFHAADACIQQGACEVLRVMCSQSEKNKDQLRECGGLYHIIRTTMKKHTKNPKIMQKACGVLCNATAGNDTNKDICVSHGVGDSLYSILISHPEHEDLQREAIAAVRNLAKLEKNRVQLSSRPALLQAVLAAMSRFVLNPILQEHIFVFLFTICDAVEVVQLLVKSQCIEGIMATIRKHENHPGVLEEAFGLMVSSHS